MERGTRNEKRQHSGSNMQREKRREAEQGGMVEQRGQLVAQHGAQCMILAGTLFFGSMSWRLHSLGAWARI